MPTSKPTRLTRREFIKLSGATSLGIALSACGVAPTPTATLSPTNTPLPTSTPAPTATSSPTATPKPTIPLKEIQGVPYPDQSLVQSAIEPYAKTFGLKPESIQLAYQAVKDYQGNFFVSAFTADKTPLLVAIKDKEGKYSWQGATLKKLGELINIIIGTSVDNTDSKHAEPQYATTVTDNFNAIVPMNAFEPSKIYREADSWIQFAKVNGLVLRIQQTFSPTMAHGQKVDAEFLNSRIRVIMPFIRKAVDQGVKIQFTLANEPFQYYGNWTAWNGEGDTKNGLYDSFGRNWITESYLSLFRIAINEFRLIPGKDFTVIGIAERGIESQGIYASFAIPEIVRVKKNIAEKLDKDVELKKKYEESFSRKVDWKELPFDIGLMYHIGEKMGGRDIVVPIEKFNTPKLLETQQKYICEQTGARLHIVEISYLGDVRQENFAYKMLANLSCNSGVVTDMFYWSTLTFYTGKNNDWPWRNVLFSPAYEKLAPYYSTAAGIWEYILSRSTPN